MIARNFEKLGKNEKAIDALNSLLQISSANADYYWNVLKLKGIEKPKDANDILKDTEMEAALNLLDTYQSLMPKSVMPRRLMLQIAQGDKFKNELETYLVP